MIDEKYMNDTIEKLKHDASCSNTKAALALERWLRLKNDWLDDKMNKQVIARDWTAREKQLCDCGYIKEDSENGD